MCGPQFVGKPGGRELFVDAIGLGDRVTVTISTNRPIQVIFVPKVLTEFDFPWYVV